MDKRKSHDLMLEPAPCFLFPLISFPAGVIPEGIALSVVFSIMNEKRQPGDLD